MGGFIVFLSTSVNALILNHTYLMAQTFINQSIHARILKVFQSVYSKLNSGVKKSQWMYNWYVESFSVRFISEWVGT